MLFARLFLSLRHRDHRAAKDEMVHLVRIYDLMKGPVGVKITAVLHQGSKAVPGFPAGCATSA